MWRHADTAAAALDAFTHTGRALLLLPLLHKPPPFSSSSTAVCVQADLIGYCQAHDLRIITSLGAGLKADPTRMCIGELDNARHDPLAVRLRHILRKKGVRHHGGVG